MDIKCQNIRCDDELKACDETFLFGFLRNCVLLFEFSHSCSILIGL